MPLSTLIRCGPWRRDGQHSQEAAHLVGGNGFGLLQPLRFDEAPGCQATVDALVFVVCKMVYLIIHEKRLRTSRGIQNRRDNREFSRSTRVDNARHIEAYAMRSEKFVDVRYAFGRDDKHRGRIRQISHPVQHVSVDPVETQPVLSVALEQLASCGVEQLLEAVHCV